MFSARDTTHTNRLAQATSPYLLQHQHNPVDWWPWGPDGAGRGQAQQPADPALGRLCRLPLVPRDGARELRGRADRARDERAVRQHQGRPRGAAGHRPDLHERAASAGRAGRLAADDVSDARRRAGVGRHLFSEGVDATAGRPSSTCCAKWRACSARSPAKIEQNRAALLAQLGRQGAPGRQGHHRADGARQRRPPIGNAFDPIHGGLRGAPKFPQSSILEMLWRAGLRTRRCALLRHGRALARDA